MTILWCGGEPIDFPNGALPSVGGGYRPAYARSALSLYQLAQPFWSNPFAAVTSCWLSAQLSTDGSYVGYPITSRLYGLVKAGAAIPGLYVGFSDLANVLRKLALFTWDGTTETVLVQEPGHSIAVGSVHKLDLQIAGYGALSTLNLYVDGARDPVISFSGDCSVPGVAALDAVAPGLYAGGGNYAYNSIGVSELIVADEDTRQMSLCSLTPTAPGDANAWTGAVTDINEVVLDDSTVLYTNTPGADAEFRLSALPPETIVVKAVKLAARGEVSTEGSAAGHVALGVKTGGVIDAGAAQPLTIAWTTLERLMTQNPVTSAAWVPADVDTLQLNLRAEA